MPSSARYGKICTAALLSTMLGARPFPGGGEDVGCGEGAFRQLLGPLLPGPR